MKKKKKKKKKLYNKPLNYFFFNFLYQHIKLFTIQFSLNNLLKLYIYIYFTNSFNIYSIYHSTTLKYKIN